MLELTRPYYASAGIAPSCCIMPSVSMLSPPFSSLAILDAPNIGAPIYNFLPIGRDTHELVGERSFFTHVNDNQIALCY